MARESRRNQHIDWESVRQRMEEALRRTHEAIEPPRGGAQRTLRARARALAVPTADHAPAEDAIDVIALGLAGAGYLIESRYVIEAVRAPLITPLPRTTDFLRGISNIRGQLLPVFDLARFFRLPPGPAPAKSELAVLGNGQAEIGILVDAIEPATRIARTNIHPDAAGRDAGHPHVAGLTADGRTLIDGPALLAEPAFFLNA